MRRVIVLKQFFDSSECQKWLLFCDQTAEFSIAFLALIASGKDVVLPPNKQTGTLELLLGSCEAALFDNSFLPESSVFFERQHFMQDLLSRDVPLPNNISEINLNLGASIAIATSGSTGQFKLIQKTFAHFVAELESLNTVWGEVVKNTTIFSTVGHQHIYGLLFRVLWPLTSGAVLRVDTHAYPESLFADMSGVDKSTLITSPAHLKRIPVAIDGEMVTGKLQMVFSSGGPLALDQALEFLKRFDVRPIEVFGSTETGGIAYRQQLSERDVPWTLLPKVEIAMDDSQCLKVKSPYVFCDDWFVMGDRVSIVDEQHFFHHGRADRIVKLEEKRLSLSAMENQLIDHVWVSEARVLLLSHQKRQMLGAVIVLNEIGSSVLQKSGKRFINEGLKKHLLSFFERSLLPRKWRYIKEMPCNSQGKIVTADLAQLFTGH